MTGTDIIRYEDELAKMIVANTPPDVACRILGIEPDDVRFADVIERSTLKAFSDKCAILTKVSEGYSQYLTTTVDNNKDFTTKVEEKVFPPDIKALQLLVDLYNGYSPGRVQVDRDETEQLIVQFVDDLDDGIIDIEIEPAVVPVTNESFL